MKKMRFQLRYHYKKNPRAIYKAIQRFARRTLLKEALTIMDQQGIPFKPITFSALEVTCIRSKSLTKAKEIQKWLENKELLRTKLVHIGRSMGQALLQQQESELVKMYGSCALVRRAKSVLNAVPVKAYGYNELWKVAIKLFDGMRASWRFTINDFTFKAVPSICVACICGGLLATAN
ncbi:hypothetical protein SADUNF_Sadunf13G0081100 [Salix dunnii]|uniref:Uncharacterized protein n=1 Tax=Salix dunnii TaxID=1413687 RepID=A0A835JLC1_9ROSI|nr:hypothetical protein SADUNF_Sadunf13G0081100 [Salix dunnii]